MRTMTRKKISDALGRLDERHINELAAFTGKKKKPVWVRWVAAAACLALIVSVFGAIVSTYTYDPMELSAEQAASAFTGYGSAGAVGTTAYTAESYPEDFFKLIDTVPRDNYLDIYTPIENIVPTDKDTFDEFFNRIMPKIKKAFDVNDNALSLDDYIFYGWSVSRRIRGSLSAEFSQFPGSHPYYRRACEELDLSGDCLRQLGGRALEINMLDSNEEIISSLHWAKKKLAAIFDIRVENMIVYRYVDGECNKIAVSFLGKSKKTSLPAFMGIYFTQDEAGSNILSCEEIHYECERAAESDYYTLAGKAPKISLEQAEEMLANGYVFGGHTCAYCMGKQEEVVFDTYDYVGFEYITGKDICIPFYAFYKKISDTDEYGNTKYAKTYVCAVELSGLTEYFEAQKAYHK